MKCADCNRPLLKAALQIDTRQGPIAFGPKCAKRYIERRAQGKRSPVSHRRVVKDERQLDWVETLAC